MSQGSSKPERLQKVLARAGVASRRAAEDLIRAGRVRVNGQAAELGQRVGESDHIEVDGKAVQRQRETVTFMLHKPAGFVTTADDELGRDTVLGAMPKVPGLHPVGRLDMDSEGLLLLSTDGDLTLRMTHPRFEHEKAYRVWSHPAPDAQALAQLAAGVALEDGPARAAHVEAAAGGALVVLREGRKRQLRRMMDAVGCPVERLLRVRVGGLWLGDLGAGEYLQLTARELELLESSDPLATEWQRQQAELTRKLWL